MSPVAVIPHRGQARRSSSGSNASLHAGQYRASFPGSDESRPTADSIRSLPMPRDGNRFQCLCDDTISLSKLNRLRQLLIAGRRAESKLQLDVGHADGDIPTDTQRPPKINVPVATSSAESSVIPKAVQTAAKVTPAHPQVIAATSRRHKRAIHPPRSWDADR